MTQNFLFQDYATGLWEVDETTRAAIRLSASALSAVEGGIAAVNGNVFFAATKTGLSTSPANQLWVTSGTTAGTKLVTTLPDLTPAGVIAFNGAQINDITALPSGKVVFNYFDGISQGVYLSDGTASGTHKASGYTGGTSSYSRASIRDGVAEISGHLIFLDGHTGAWSVDETTNVATALPPDNMSTNNFRLLAVLSG